MSVLTVCLDEIVTASGLPWRELAETGETPPIEPGVYAWVSSKPSDGNAVLYIGQADRLRRRLNEQREWIRKARAEPPQDRQRLFSGHPRLALRYAARVHYAVTGDIGETATAVDAERRLLHFCRFATGAVPLINGSAWWTEGASHDEAREQAWAAIETAGLVLPD